MRIRRLEKSSAIIDDQTVYDERRYTVNQRYHSQGGGDQRGKSKDKTKEDEVRNKKDSKTRKNRMGKKEIRRMKE